MNKKISLLMFFFVFFMKTLFAQNMQDFKTNIKILNSQFYIIKNKKITLEKNRKKSYCSIIQKKIKKIYGIPLPGENGIFFFQIIIRPSIGKIGDYLIFKNEGNKAFKKHIKLFLKKIKKEKILYSLDNKVYQFKMLISIKSKKELKNINQYLVFGKNKTISDPYKNYLIYLLKYKKYSKKYIKKILNSKKVTLTKAMLYYLYFRYKKINKQQYQHYFNFLKNNLNKIKGKIEAVFLSQEFLLNGEYFKVLEILPNGSCEMFPEYKLKSICNYYQGIAKYISNYDTFLINFKKSQNLEPSRKFLQDIGY